MKRLLLLLSVIPALVAGAMTRDEIRTEIAATPGKAGGIYFAYPFTTDSLPDAPAGYEPFQIIHYGRHGSRWAINEKQYDIADMIFGYQSQLDNLTPLGRDVMGRIARIGTHARGHSGELSPMGERQHKGIASRMAARFPRLFADSAVIVARSSLEPRCIVSMAAFCERLKEINPSLRIERHATPGDMNFIAYRSPESVKMGKDSAEWRTEWRAFRDSVVPTGRLMTSLFVDTALVDHHGYVTKILYDIAIDLQDVDGLDEELFDIFTTDELFNLWQAKNYEMYYRHGNAPAADYTGPRSAASLLKRFITLGDNAALSRHPGVTLHFGHDTFLIRFMSLMGLDRLSGVESDPNLYCEAWQDFKASPMAANFQMIFYKNPEEDAPVMVHLRHNERPASLPIPEIAPGFYEWNAVRDFWTERLNFSFTD